MSQDTKRRPDPWKRPADDPTARAQLARNMLENWRADREGWTCIMLPYREVAKIAIKHQPFY
jgi:hypothetical protein